jgi:hypothetical protein
MRTRRVLLGLLILAGAVGLALVALRERRAPSRSVPPPAPEAIEADVRTDATADEESDLGEGTLWGTVAAPAGVDVTEVRIVVFTKMGVFRSSNAGVMNFRASLDVGHDGTFRRDGLPLGEYQLFAEHPPCGSCRTPFELRPGRGTGPLHVVLGSPGSLLVRIVGAVGRGLSGEHVALHRGGGSSDPEYRLEPGGPETAAGLTDAEGEIRFENLEPGAFTLTRRGTIIEQRVATVQAAGETVVLFDASASLFGRLLGHDGQPIPGAKLLLRASGGRIYETRTDEGGALAIRGIAAGGYGVTASVKGLGTAAIPLAETLVIEDGRTDERDLRLPAIRLTGSVVHAESGAPFTPRKVRIQAWAINDKGGALTFHAFAFTAAGRFELADLYPGRYSIQADPDPPDDGYEESASEVVTVTPTPATQELVIGIPRLAKTARLRLTVRDQHGNPAADLCFSIDGHIRTRYAKGILSSRDATVVEAGVYDIPRVPGAHRIRVSTQLGTEPGHRSCYWEEFSIELEAGQTAEKAIALDKLLEY